MNNNTKLRIRGSRKLFESIAQEILAEAKGGKSHAQKLTEKMIGKKKKEKVEEASTELKEAQFIRIKNDFTLDGNNFKKGDFVRAAKEFNAIEAAAKLGKIKKSDFEVVIGSAPLREKESKKLQEFDDYSDDDFGTGDVFAGAEESTEEDLKSDLIKAGFSEEEAAKTAAQLVRIGKTKK